MFWESADRMCWLIAIPVLSSSPRAGLSPINDIMASTLCLPQVLIYLFQHDSAMRSLPPRHVSILSSHMVRSLTLISAKSSFWITLLWKSSLSESDSALARTSTVVYSLLHGDSAQPGLVYSENIMYESQCQLCSSMAICRLVKLHGVISGQMPVCR